MQLENGNDLILHYREIRNRINKAGYSYQKKEELEKRLKRKQHAEEMAAKIKFEKEMVNDLKSNWRLIVENAAMKINMSVNEFLTSKSRSQSLVYARHEVYYLLKKNTNMSFPKIGSKFGKDHTTILHGYRSHIQRNRLEQ